MKSAILRASSTTMRRRVGRTHRQGFMTTSVQQQFTVLLRAWSTGDESALEKLTPLVYNELRRLARHYMAMERQQHVLQTTALVHEAYLRLMGRKNVDFQKRNQFFALAAQVMRHVLVDYARSRNSDKRGGGAQHISLDDVGAVVSSGSDPNLLVLDKALQRLAEVDQRKSTIVELRFFGGLTVEETAAVLKVSPFTVLRDWKIAKAWLLREMSGASHDEI